MHRSKTEMWQCMRWHGLLVRRSGGGLVRRCFQSSQGHEAIYDVCWTSLSKIWHLAPLCVLFKGNKRAAETFRTVFLRSFLGIFILLLCICFIFDCIFRLTAFPCSLILFYFSYIHIIPCVYVQSAQKCMGRWGELFCFISKDVKQSFNCTAFLHMFSQVFIWI